MRLLDDGSESADGNPGNMYEYLGRTKEARQQYLSVFYGMGWSGRLRDQMNLLTKT